ncbi:MAG: NADH-quinone oxidoreductase subunit L [Candidatus Riflebacteria bacterium]|nr:NADH-quinone oxidoreductase subunit L [Candidatus Riflebacteria bacterium]
MTSSIQLLLFIVVPIISSLLVFMIRDKLPKIVLDFFSFIVVIANFLMLRNLMGIGEFVIRKPWLGYGFELAFRFEHFNSLVLLALAGFAIVIIFYSIGFFKNHPNYSLFYGFSLLTLGLANGSLVSDNLLLFLFFWEALLLPLYGMVAIGSSKSFRTANKALIISGVGDLCLMLGIGLVVMEKGLVPISQLSIAPYGSMGFAFILMMLGGIAKAGAVPFHTWIPDAAIDAPLPFMAFVPAALEKLLGIYFLGILTLRIFTIQPDSWASMLMMTIGVITILVPVMMALIQKDFKRLLSYHAVSQVGYMILGVGTAVPAGIIGGLFHMFNHAIYKCCLFLSGGAVESTTGTTDLNKLGGIGWKMPVTTTCFTIAALSISGVPPFNGFFSKELVYDGALERHWIFYAGALLGSVLTGASFLKLGHAAFFGKRSEEYDKVGEASIFMLLPMIFLASLCIFLGIKNEIPVSAIELVLGKDRIGDLHFFGWPHSHLLVGLTAGAILLAIINHIFGVIRSGSGLKASDHIHYAPILHDVYDLAEKKCFDPYEIFLDFIDGLSVILFAMDRFLDFVLEGIIAGTTNMISGLIRNLHTGNYSTYLLWSVFGGMILIGWLFNSL